jgi:hypothetical protein
VVLRCDALGSQYLLALKFNWLFTSEPIYGQMISARYIRQRCSGLVESGQSPAIGVSTSDYQADASSDAKFKIQRKKFSNDTE